MSDVLLSRVPLQTRADAVRDLIRRGEVDPFDGLAAILSDGSASFTSSPTVVDGFCVNGHPWNEDNLYVRSNGFRVCRACARNTKRKRLAQKDWQRQKVPCSRCGAPCCPPGSKGAGALPIARCRSCYMAERRKR